MTLCTCTYASVWLHRDSSMNSWRFRSFVLLREKLKFRDVNVCQDSINYSIVLEPADVRVYYGTVFFLFVCFGLAIFLILWKSGVVAVSDWVQFCLCPLSSPVFRSLLLRHHGATLNWRRTAWDHRKTWQPGLVDINQMGTMQLHFLNYFNSE